MGKHDLGDASYDEHEFGSEWWFARAHSRVHRRAYQRIVADISANLRRRPRHIVDYACGPGLLLRELARSFPTCRLTGIDESAQCLEAADQVLTSARGLGDLERITLYRAMLPDFELDLPKADVAVFSFPDLRVAGEKRFVKRWKKRCKRDWRVSKRLRRRLRREDDEFDFSAREIFTMRLAHRNLRALVKRGGLIVTVDYADADRHDCDEGYQQAMAWYEGTLDPKIPEAKPKRDRLTRTLKTRYHRSQVILDVHEQTGDPDDKRGGFLLHVLQAV